MEWRPITLEELSLEISKGENKIDTELSDFWEMVKITPKKWTETKLGNKGNDFWAVAKYKNLVLYYNDIEDLIYQSLRMMVKLWNIVQNKMNYILQF